MEREHRRRLCNCSKATERRGVFGKFIPKNASNEGAKFFDRIISIAINEISQNEIFDFQQSKVFEIITEEDLNLYFELIPRSLFGSDFIFIQRKIFGLILFFRAIGAKLPLLKILSQQSKDN